MSAGPFVVGMIGNITHRKAHVAAKVSFVYPTRVIVALYSSHSDRMLFGDRAMIGTVGIANNRFRPCDLSVQPPDVRAAIAKARDK